MSARTAKARPRSAAPASVLVQADVAFARNPVGWALMALVAALLVTGAIWMVWGGAPVLLAFACGFLGLLAATSLATRDVPAIAGGTFRYRRIRADIVSSGETPRSYHVAHDGHLGSLDSYDARVFGHIRAKGSAIAIPKLFYRALR